MRSYCTWAQHNPINASTDLEDRGQLGCIYIYKSYLSFFFFFFFSNRGMFLGWGVSHWNLGFRDLSRLVGPQVPWVAFL